MGMLGNQQQILKQQNELLGENQKQLSQMLQNFSSKNQYSTQESSQNVQFLQTLLQPINEQLKEIKELHNQTVTSQKQMIQSNTQEGIQNFTQKNEQLKGLMDTVQHNLTFLQPENFSALQNFTNFNLRIYQDTIQNLQHQIQTLQEEHYRMESDLDVKYKQLNNPRLQHQIQRNKNEEDETLKTIQNQISGINHQELQKKVQQKLGGEFDYDEYLDLGITTQAQELMQEYINEGKQFDLDLPEFKVDEKDLKALNIKQYSILDEIKDKLGEDYVRFVNQQKQPQVKPKVYEAAKSQEKYKPAYEVKQEQEKPIQEVRRPVEEQRRPETPPKPSPEKLIYRKKPIPKKQQPPKYGEIQYLPDEQFEKEMEERPLIHISYNPNQNQNSNQKQNNKQREDQQKQQKPPFSNKKSQQIQQQPQQRQQSQQKVYPQKQGIIQQESVLDVSVQQDSNVFVSQHINPINPLDQYQLEQQVELQGEYVNYDKLMNEIGQYNEYQTQDQKSGELLKRLGLEQINPKNEKELIEFLSKDIMREKINNMIQNQPKEVKPQESANIMRVNQQTSPIVSQVYQPQQSLQDQTQQGVQALITGMLTAFNNTFAQVNTGIFSNIQAQLPKFDESSSDYTSSESEVSFKQSQAPKQVPQFSSQIMQSQQIPPQAQVLLGPQQYTFASDFNPNKAKTVNLKDYYRQFEAESSNPSYADDVHNNRSYNVFNTDDSVDRKSEGQVSIHSQKTKRPLTKDIFKELQSDLSEGEMPQYKKNQ